jgi:hypothetical protein
LRKDNGQDVQNVSFVELMKQLIIFLLLVLLLVLFGE